MSTNTNPTPDQSQPDARSFDVGSQPTLAATPTPQPTPNFANAPTATTPTTPTNQPPQRPSWHAQVFDGILKGLSGGDRKIVNPDGTVTTVPFSRANAGKAIVAAALTGLFSPPRYRETPFGPARDFGASMAEAGQAGAKTIEQYQQAPQKLSDDEQSRRLMTLTNNAHLLQLQAASAHLGHQMREENQADNDAFLKPFRELHDVDPNAPKPFLYEGLDHDVALDMAKKGQFGLTTSNVVQDGWRPTTDGQGNQSWVPTYAVINPALKDIALPKEVTDKLAEMHSQWTDIHQAVGGDVRIPVNAYVSAMHDYQAVRQMEHMLQRLNVSLGGEDKPIDIASTVKDNPRLLKGLYDLTNINARGNTPDEGEQPDMVLEHLIHSAPELLDNLGLTTGTATDKMNQLRVAAKQMQQMGDKALVDPAKITALPTLAANAGLTPAETAIAMAELPKTGATNADYAKVMENIRHQHDTNAQLAANRNKDQGDPADIARIARHLVDDPTSLTTMRDIGTRGTQREAILAAADKLAQSEGKTFDIGLVNQRVKFLEQYEDPKGKAAINRQAINNIMQHAGDVSDLNELNRRANVKIVNTPVNALKDQFGDQVFTQYQTAVGVLKDELGLYFAGGYSPTKDQQAMWDKIQADTATPAQTEAFAKEVIRLATRRADTFNQQFKTNMGYDDPNMLTPQAKSAAERLGLGDAVAQFKSGGQLGGPVVQNQPQMPKMVSVQIPGQLPGSISADKVAAFKLKYPNAIIGGQQ